MTMDITKQEYRTFDMDGSEHTAPSCLTGCCAHFGGSCRECGGWCHYQPVYGGYYYKCENCGKTDINLKETQS